jgi:phage terminase small subunit
MVRTCEIQLDGATKTIRVRTEGCEANPVTLVPDQTRMPELPSRPRACASASLKLRPRAIRMTPKQKRFIAEYSIDLNATRAAIRAGYSKRSAAQIGERLLRNVEISTAVQKANDKILTKAELTAEEVIQRIWDNVKRCEDPNDYQPFAVFKGLELLGKHLGLFTNKIEHSSSFSIKDAVMEGWERVIER